MRLLLVCAISAGCSGATPLPTENDPSALRGSLLPRHLSFEGTGDARIARAEIDLESIPRLPLPALTGRDLGIEVTNAPRSRLVVDGAEQGELVAIADAEVTADEWGQGLGCSTERLEQRPILWEAVGHDLHYRTGTGTLEPRGCILRQARTAEAKLAPLFGGVLYAVRSRCWDCPIGSGVDEELIVVAPRATEIHGTRAWAESEAFTVLRLPFDAGEGSAVRMSIDGESLVTWAHLAGLEVPLIVRLDLGLQIARGVGGLAYVIER